MTTIREYHTQRTIPRVAAMHLSPLQTAVLSLLLATSAESLTFSSRRGRGLLLRGASNWRVDRVTQLQCQAACVQRGNCRSYNYHAPSGRCEVFQYTLCDHHGYYTSRYSGWTWYDSVPDLREESSQLMWNQPLCVNYGYCRDSCTRHLGQYCRHTDQCRLKVSGSVHCRSYRCQCVDSHWQYNNTLCLQKNELTSDGRHWVWKSMVGGLCSSEFDVRAAGTVQLLLAEGYSTQANHYEITIGETASGARVELRRNGVSIDATTPTETPTTAAESTTQPPVTKPSNCSSNATNSADTAGTSTTTATTTDGGCITETTTTAPTTTTTTVPPPLVTDSRHTKLLVHWCDGQLRVGPSGGTADLSWDDPARLQPTHLAFRTPGGGRGLWRFPEKLVDPWFGVDWSPQRIYTIPGDTVVARRRKPAQQDFWVEFECRSGAGCGWEARNKVAWSSGVVRRVIIGVNGDEERHPTSWRYRVEHPGYR